MLLGFCLLLCVCGSTVNAFTSSPPPNTTEEKLILQVTAVPDYPVASGQNVQLSCRSASSLNPILWNWSHLQNDTWKKVNDDNELTLSKPEDSGKYRCYAETRFQKSVSQNLTVFIVSFIPHQTDEVLGEAALALSILILIFLIAAFLWFMSQKFCHQLTISSTPKEVEATPRPKVVPNVCKPPADADVYMNYTGPNPSYTDLDPTNMAGDNLYSSLS